MLLSTHYGPYVIRSLAARPWVTVVDADGFPDQMMNRYLRFLAWQDATPALVRSDARYLTDAATWLDFMEDTWATVTEADWAYYCANLAGPVPRARWRVQRLVTTLHRAYAFWHWDNPGTVSFQPFPARAADREKWVDWALAQMITRSFYQG